MDCFNAVKDKVAAQVNHDRQSVAHRMDHVQRVLQNAYRIASHYPEADLELLKLGVLLHDVCQPFDRKEEHVELSVEIARKILDEIGYPSDRAERVLQIISEHSTECLDARRPTSLEARILFDADKLDGLGANGIARVFALFGQRGRTPLDAIPWYLGKIEMAGDNMQTTEGRQMAADSVKYVLNFIERIKAENGMRDKNP